MKRELLWSVLITIAVISPEMSAYAQTSYRIESDAPAPTVARTDAVSLDFKDANLKDILKVFSQQSGLNFVASKSVEDKIITLFMRDVQVEDALRTLLEANNLTLQQSPGSNILIVREKPTPPVETITRVYRIRYFHGRARPGSSQGRQQQEDSVLQGPWQDIIKPLLSNFGSVVAFANLIIVTDVPDRFKLIDQVVSEIDRPIAAVMLEVELIETTADFWKKAGMKWNQQYLEYSGPATITPFPYTRWEKSHNPIAPFSAISPLDGADFAYGLVSSQAMGFMLEMLQADTNSKFLAKPRLMVQDRESAELKVVANQIVSLKQDVTVSQGVRSVEIEVERMEVGTVLRLVPVINEPEGFVSLLLEPSISRPIASNFTDFQGQPFVDPQERSLRTVVMVRDGQTIVVGGFITTEDQEVKTKVPVLGELPLVGNLFKNSSMTKVDKELLIFITPRIVRPTQPLDVADAPAPESAAAGQATPAGSAEFPASFREQEDIRLDLTLQPSAAGVLNLTQ